MTAIPPTEKHIREHTPSMDDIIFTRRQFLQRTGMGFGAMSLASVFSINPWAEGSVASALSYGHKTIARAKSKRRRLKRQGRFAQARKIKGQIRTLRVLGSRIKKRFSQSSTQDHNRTVKSKGVCRSSSKTSCQCICTSVPPTFFSDTDTEPAFLFSILSNQREGTASGTNFASSRSKPTTTSSRAVAMNPYSVSRTQLVPQLIKASRRRAGNPNHARAFQSRFLSITPKTEN